MYMGKGPRLHADTCGAVRGSDSEVFDCPTSRGHDACYCSIACRKRGRSVGSPETLGCLMHICIYDSCIFVQFSCMFFGLGGVGGWRGGWGARRLPSATVCTCQATKVEYAKLKGIKLEESCAQ